MKTMHRIITVAAVFMMAITAWSGQTQQIESGEVPEGITAEDWGIVQEAYLKASNTDTGDRFGDSVAISGDTLVVGASREDSGSTGVNGNQADDSTYNSGAVYVFVRNGSTWIQQAYLKASNTDGSTAINGDADSFGASVAISGDTIVVGAWGEASNATGVNGNQDDNSTDRAGAAYVFVRDGSTWSQQGYLKASNASKWFGASVAIFGDTIVIGAHWESTGAYGAGAAYVFMRKGTVWSQQAYLKAPVIGLRDFFGSSVDISGDTIVVGSSREDSNATGVNGNQTDDSADESGAAYVFVRSGSTWSLQAYLKASNTDARDSFGGDVAISGDTIVVGASAEDSSATGVNGNQSDNNAASAGAAYVFTRVGTTWSQQFYLKASNADEGDGFGGSVAIGGGMIVVGAGGEDSRSTGINGNQSDDSANDAGAAYVFTYSGSAWSQQAYLKASNTDYPYDVGDMFGRVAISGDTIVIGAVEEDSSAIGINGNHADNSANTAGATYVFCRGTGPYGAAIIGFSSIPSGSRLEWIPVPGWHSVVKCSTDLVNTPFTDLSATLPYPVNSYTDTVSNGKCFYKVDLEP